MASNNDEDFGLSSSDEAELLDIEDKENQRGTKRKSQNDESSLAKRPCGDASTSAELQVASKVLREHFGLEEFRLKQAAAIERLLKGDSCVVVFPTGLSIRSTGSSVANPYS